MRKQPTYEELETFAEQLEGPMGFLLRRAGEIMETRMRERSQTWDVLDDIAVANMLASAVMQAAPDAYPGIDQSVIDDVLGRMASDLSIVLTATVVGSDTIN